MSYDCNFDISVCSSSPLVTVVIPVFNVDKYIKKCLLSVIGQTYKNLEILCIDDVGTDDSMKKVISFLSQEPRIRVIRHKENLGLGPTRNSGIQEAKGDFIYFLDSDDWIKPYVIERLVQKALMNASDIVVGSGVAFPDTEDLTLKKSAEKINEWLKLEGVPQRITLSNFRYSLGLLPCVAWGKLYKTSFIVKNKLAFIDKKVCHEDNGFYIKCMSCNPKISVVNDYGYQYRIRNASLMNFGGDSEERDLEHLRLSIEDALGYLINTNKHEEYATFVKDLYWKFFAFRKSGLLFYWGRYTKILKIWRVSLFKQTCKSGGGRAHSRDSNVEVALIF